MAPAEDPSELMCTESLQILASDSSVKARMITICADGIVDAVHGVAASPNTATPWANVTIVHGSHDRKHKN